MASDSPCEEALSLVNGERREAYGHPRDNFEQIAQLWTGYLMRKLKPGEVITKRDIGWMQILSKASRDSHHEKHDNLVDTAGYAEATYLATQEENPPSKTGTYKLPNDVHPDDIMWDAKKGYYYVNHDGEPVFLDPV